MTGGSPGPEELAELTARYARETVREVLEQLAELADKHASFWDTVQIESRMGGARWSYAEGAAETLRTHAQAIREGLAQWPAE